MSSMNGHINVRRISRHDAVFTDPRNQEAPTVDEWANTNIG